MKSQGFSETPQDIMEKYNGCSARQYTAYPRVPTRLQPAPKYTEDFADILNILNLVDLDEINIADFML
jgi:hypothetical protein